MPVVAHPQQDQIEARNAVGSLKTSRRRRSYAAAAASGVSASVSHGWTLVGGIGTRSRNPRRASPALLSGDPSGTQRSSPQKTCTRSHGMRERYGSRVRIVPICFGVLPPERAANACPRAATASSTARANR